jgi:hypothetical protein
MLPLQPEKKDVMAKDEIDEEELEVDLEEIEDLDDLVVVDDEEDLDDVEVDDAVDVDIEDADDAVDTTAAKPAEGDDEDEELPHADDVEASLDVILKERLVVEDDTEDEELVDLEDRSDGVERVLPKQSDEFVCTSCFLVKNSNQRAASGVDVCRDCV